MSEDRAVVDDAEGEVKKPTRELLTIVHRLGAQYDLATTKGPAWPRRSGRPFPRLGLENSKPTPVSRTIFFATSPFALLESSELGVPIPRGGPFHAKEMGTTTTVCGKSSLSWPKLWEVPFSKDMESVCSTCVVAVERRRKQCAIPRRHSIR